MLFHHAALRFEHEFFLVAQWLLLVKQARNLIQRVICTTARLVLLRRRHLDHCDLRAIGCDWIADNLSKACWELGLRLSD